MKKIKSNIKKGGYRGSEIWTAHRLEGVVKNKAIKAKKKKEQPKPRTKPLTKSHNPDKLSIPRNRSALLMG